MKPRNRWVVGLGAGVLALLPALFLYASDTARSPALPCRASGAPTSRVFAAAAPDDANDARAGLQRQIDAAAAAGGGKVTLSPGIYPVSSAVVLRDKVWLAGSGPDTVLKAGTGFLAHPAHTGGFPVITTAGADDVTVSDLTADQSGNTLDGNVSGRLDGYLIEVRHSHNAVIDSVHTRNPFTYSIAVVGSSRFCVHASSTTASSSGRYDQLDGIHVLDSSSGDVVGNTVDQRIGSDGDDGLVAHSLGAPVYDVRYFGNKVRGGNHGSGLQFASGDYPIYDITVRDNEFWGSPLGITTGQWDNGRGQVHDITVEGNDIHDLSPAEGSSARANAIEIGPDPAAGRGGGRVPGVTGEGNVSGVTVRDNQICRAGRVLLNPAPGNVETGTTGCPQQAPSSRSLGFPG